MAWPKGKPRKTAKKTEEENITPAVEEAVTQTLPDTGVSESVAEPIPQPKAISKNGLIRIKVTQEELMKLQKEKKLVGFDPTTREAIIKEEANA